jgi:hypothetical protein
LAPARPLPSRWPCNCSAPYSPQCSGSLASASTVARKPLAVRLAQPPACRHT